MRLYRTANGRWEGTQADAAKATREEGSKPGSWFQVEVPTDKLNLLDFLNHGLRRWQLPPEPEQKAPPAPKANGSDRFRVYFKGLFAGVVVANDQAEAEATVPGLIEVRLDTSNR